MGFEVDKMDDRIRELTLLLLYLTSWREGTGVAEVHRSWKGYSFDVLNDLSDIGLIEGSPRSKSVCITEEGIKKAEELMMKYIENKR